MHLDSHSAATAVTPSLGWRRLLVCGGLAVCAALGTNAARAADVYWSVGVQSPGAVIELANAPRVVYGAPVMMVPAPMYRVEERHRHRKHWKHHHRHEYREYRDYRRDDGHWDRNERYDGDRRDRRDWR